MKKIIIVMSMCSMISVSYAQSEFDALFDSLTPDIVFAGGEGAYNWIQTDSFFFNDQRIKQAEQNWGGRASAGLLYFPTDKFGIGLEMGWGYYGRVSVSSNIDRWSASKHIQGYDVLFDMQYTINKIDLLGNVGFMIQKQNFNLNTYNNDSNFRTNLDAALVNFYDKTEILPEVKLGGVYHLTNNIGISLAYMYVFGSEYQNSDSGDDDSGDGDGSKNPSLGTLMLGVRYSFEP